VDLKYVGRLLLNTEEGCTRRQIPAKIISLYILKESFYLFHEHVKYCFLHLNSFVSLKPCLMSWSQYGIGKSVIIMVHRYTHLVKHPLQNFRYGIHYETSFNIQIHPSRKTDAEIDEYTHIFMYLIVSKILKAVLITALRRVIRNLKLSLS
jgi:hypothetical protein